MTEVPVPTCPSCGHYIHSHDKRIGELGARAPKIFLKKKEGFKKSLLECVVDKKLTETESSKCHQSR